MARPLLAYRGAENWHGETCETAPSRRLTYPYLQLRAQCDAPSAVLKRRLAITSFKVRIMRVRKRPAARFKYENEL